MAKQKFGKFELELLADPHIAGQTVKPETTELMGKLLEDNLHFAIDSLDRLYVFENGIYRLVGKDIYTCCMDIYQKYRLGWSSRKDNELDNYLIKRAKPLLERPDGDKINLKNGLYYIHEDRFEPHSEVDHSWYRTTIQIPVNYDPNAICPSIDKFMQDVFPEGYELLYDIIGMCMTSVTSHHTAIVLLGSGSNGKSIYLYGLRSAVGFDNCSTTPMHVLADSKNRFANNDLVGKLVNAGDDTRQERILETDNVKSIISGSPVMVEAKFKTSVTYRPFCKLIFGSNHRLVSNDETLGFVRRIMHIPLSRTFAKNPDMENKLQAMFSDPVELSGMFNQIRKRLSKTCKEGFIIPEAADVLVNSYDPIPKESEEWLLANVVADPDGRIACTEFQAAYLYGAEREESVSRVSRYVKQLFPESKKARPRIEGKQIPYYFGIRLIGEEALKVSKSVLPEIDYLDPEKEENS